VTHQQLISAIYDDLCALPLLDAHTHLIGGKLAARGLHDVLLYHMAVSDLYAAGCPSGARLTQYPGWPSRAEAHERIREALPFLSRVRNTSISWGVRLILKDLYGWDQPITADNWERMDEAIRERADDRAWNREIIRRANIRRFVTEHARREGGVDDEVLRYSLEWAFFTRCQWGEFDTALYELEKVWGKLPASPTALGVRTPTERVIRTLDDVHAAMDHYVTHIPYEQIVSTATGISADLNLEPVSAEVMAEALRRREQAGVRERDIYASYLNEALLTALEERGGIVFQFSYGAEPLPFETSSRVSDRSLSQIAEMVARHPRLSISCSLGSRHANQALCTFCRELPNFSLAGYWWHNFFPSVMRQVMEERLDMLPANKQIGFFSDAYCVEWSYAKAKLVLNQLAIVLAQKVAQGQYTRNDAVQTAQAILFESCRDLMGVQPAVM
jgi:glucuronate isomerase